MPRNMNPQWSRCQILNNVFLLYLALLMKVTRNVLSKCYWSLVTLYVNEQDSVVLYCKLFVKGFYLCKGVLIFDVPLFIVHNLKRMLCQRHHCQKLVAAQRILQNATLNKVGLLMDTPTVQRLLKRLKHQVLFNMMC